MISLKNSKKKNGTNIYDQQIADEEKLFKETKNALKKYQSATDEGLKQVTLTWQDNLDKQLSEITGSNVEFRDAGNGNVQMYIDGVVQGKPKSKEEIAKLVQSTILEISKQKTGAETAGKDLLDGLNNGIGNEKKQQGIFGRITTFGQTLLSKLKSSLKEHSPSKATEEMGAFLLKGLVNGINKEEKSVQKTVSKLGSTMLKNVSKKLIDIASVSKTLIENADKGITSAIKTSEAKVKKTIDTYFTNLQKDNEKKQSKLQKQIDNTKNKTTRKQLQSQLKTLKEQNKEIKSLYNNFGKTAINEFNSALETATKGTTDKIKAKLQNLADKMKQEIDNVNSKISSMKDKLTNYGDLFTKETKDGKEVVSLSNINDQISALQKYNNNLTKLKGKVSDNLMNEITNMSVEDALLYTDKLLSMNQKDFKAYNDAYNKKMSLANKISNNFYSDKIKEIKENYTDKIKKEFENAQKEIEKIGTNTLKGFIKGMKKTDYTKDIKSIAKNIIKAMQSGINSNSLKSLGLVGAYPGHANGLAYVPYDNYVARLHKGERVLTAKENQEYMSKNISNKVSNNIVVNFYPQKMTDSEMENAFNFINRKFGRLI